MFPPTELICNQALIIPQNGAVYKHIRVYLNLVIEILETVLQTLNVDSACSHVMVVSSAVDLFYLSFFRGLSFL